MPAWPGITMTPQFGVLTDSTGAQGVITANYGSGSPQMAAAWVAYCNAAATNAATIGLDPAGRDWKTAAYWAAVRGASPISPDDGLNVLRASHPAPYGYKNWEIGNECYGSWENDTHAAKQDPVIYANFAQSATALMKQVNPTIATGVVVTSTEDDSGNQTETVTNPVTGKAHKGWTAVLLSTLSGLGYTPDFVIYHNYAQGPGSESDAYLLQYAPTWTTYATSIRTMLTQYIGAPKTASCQLICTENNSVYSGTGKQTTSLVDGLYYCTSLGYVMQTEFKGLVWWDTRNGGVTNANNSASLYGWRQYGDYGFIGSAGVQPGGDQNTPYPAYFAFKLGSKFARGGDVVVGATTDYPLLNVFAAKRANGGLSLMVVNTNPSSAVNTSFSLSGYTPAGTATQYQYGEAEDTLQSNGGDGGLDSVDSQRGRPAFSAAFPAYSMSVINLTPVLPTTTAALSGTAGTNGWYTSPVQVTLTAMAGAAWHIASSYYAIDNGATHAYTTPFPVPGDGTHTVTYWSVDSAGNTETAKSLTIKIDATAPTLAFGAASPVANPAGWNNGAVSLPVYGR